MEVNMMDINKDLAKMKDIRKELSEVYDSQVNDGVVDNGNLSEIHNAILNVQTVIRWLESKINPE